MQVCKPGSCFILALLVFICSNAIAQDVSDTSKISGRSNYPTKKFYSTSGFDAALLQVANIMKFDRGNLSILRFSYFLNADVNLNYDFSKRAGVFTGLGIKNIGFIDKTGNDSTIKRRVYTIGAPLGIKFGNLSTRKFGFVGGGLDIPFHYKEKGFKQRSDKKKSSEWLSDKPSFLMPYVFAGVSVSKALSLKLQFYPMEFMNSSYSLPTSAGLIYPFANYNAEGLLFLSISINPGSKMIERKKKKDMPKKEA